MKTAELTDITLDWAVAIASGKRPSMFIFQQTGKLSPEHNYSTDWAQGGPIMDRENIEVKHHDVYVASIYYRDGIGSDECLFKATGPTMLVAAMRCYVASKLGDEITIPEELL